MPPVPVQGLPTHADQSPRVVPTTQSCCVGNGSDAGVLDALGGGDTETEMVLDALAAGGVDGDLVAVGEALVPGDSSAEATGVAVAVEQSAEYHCHTGHVTVAKGPVELPWKHVLLLGQNPHTGSPVHAVHLQTTTTRTATTATTRTTRTTTRATGET
jgi:hypothetical protein